MKLSEHQIILDLATTNPELMPFLTPVERAIIEVCQKVIEESGGARGK